MLKSCQYCGRIHDSRFDCGKKPKSIKLNTEADKFRWARKWRYKREVILKRDNYLCQVCKDNKQYKYDDLEVHHIVPLEQDFSLRLDDDNLITLCNYHHELAEKGEIKRDYLKSLIK